MVKEIELTQGQVALVDDWWYSELKKYEWKARWSKSSQSFYADRGETHYDKGGHRRSRAVQMHRTIAITPSGMECDHINHDTLDNREDNLRNCTKSQNQRNRKGASRRSSTGVLGVEPGGTGFRAQISVKGRVRYFPVRPTIEEAIEDRRLAEQKYYGEYAGDSNAQ